jgi:cysteinyl-tRNA synthetase
LKLNKKQTELAIMGSSILDLIGNTPLVTIRHVNPNPQVKILAKLEYCNPGGSIKDRAALSMIEDGERSGRLTPEKIVLEATSGNTGIGLAMVCTVKGYRLMLAMSEAVSIERQKILKARGAEILLTPGHLGTDGAIEEVYRLARENPDLYFMTDQYNNEANWRAHYHGTAEEVWAQTGGAITTLVATLGTSGTLMGMSRRLKAYDSRIRIVGVEPYLGHKIQGLKNMKEAYRPEIYEKNRLDDKPNIDDEEAFEMARRLAREEGLFVGMSSGAAMAIACKEAAGMGQGTVVVILPDGGERYLSTSLFDVRDKVKMVFFNTMSRRKEAFEPHLPGKVGLYSCGPTAHARMHVNEGRRFVFSDLLHRYLEYRGFEVQHIMNITDQDDKTILGSERAGMSLEAFTAQYIEAFKNDLAALFIKPADHYPRASEHVEEMIRVVQQLVGRGFAYEKLRSIYFDISRFKDYGRLSGVDLNKIRLGATVDLDEYEKDNPRDFTLLKRSKLTELKRGIYTKTEWGNVRPSWHLQCAAMSMKYLGENYDVHTAGRELVFPHHENGNAIAAALSGKSLARYWLHCERVLVEGKKVDERSHPLTIAKLLEQGWNGREIRYWLLVCHYRKPLIFSEARLKDARSSLRRLAACIQALMQVKEGEACAELDQLLYDIRQGFISAMDDDLNISAAMASIFKNIKQINMMLHKEGLNRAGADRILKALEGIDTVLQVFDFGRCESNPRIDHLLAQRLAARKAKNWTEADRIRDQLIQLGAVVADDKIADL